MPIPAGSVAVPDSVIYDTDVYSFPYEFTWKSFGVEPDADSFTGKRAYYIKFGYDRPALKGSKESWSAFDARIQHLKFVLCFKE